MSINKHSIVLVGMAALAAILFLMISPTAQAAPSRPTEVGVFNPKSGEKLASFSAFAEQFDGGGSVAVCDLDGNGYEETVVGAGPGGGPQVRVFDSQGNPKFTPGFFAYDVNFRGGVNVACGDLDADGKAEIVTASHSRGGPHVRTFNRYGEPVFTPGFFAYDPGFKGGVNVAVGDIDGGGLAEIIVAPAESLEPEVKVFNRSGDRVNFDIYPFHPEFAGGVSLAVANVDGGAESELVVAVQSQDVAWVKVIKPGVNQAPLSEFAAFPQTFKGGVNVAGGDVDGDGFDEVVVAANSGGGPHVRAFEGSGEELPFSFFAYESDFRGGVQAAVGDVNRDGRAEIVTIPRRQLTDGEVDLIVVDLSEQRVYAYDNDYLLRTFLVSSGLPGMDTQVGTFSVSQKVYSKLYAGPGYYLPNTLWNLRFDGPRWLHGAYWHNDFGRRKSHGCVNIAYPNAEWLYSATPLGTTVIVRQ